MVDYLEDVDQIYRFDIITDPDDPSVQDSLDKLLTLVDNDQFILTETNLDRGLVRYTIDTVYNSNQNPDAINRISQLVGEVGYTPVTVSMDTSRFMLTNGQINVGSIITGAKEVIKVLTEQILKVDINNVETLTRENNIITFTPINKNNKSVYENPMYLANYYYFVNMDILGGYQVLSKDPTVKYVLDELYNGQDYVPEDINPTYVHGVSLIPVGTAEEEDHYMKIKNRVNTIITTRRQDGYFSIELGLHNIADVLLISQLAKLWHTEIVYEADNVNIILKHDHVDFGTRPELWFQHNLEVIKEGNFPTITLYGIWQFKVGGDYNQIYGKQWSQAIIQYGALLAYRKLGLEDPFIQPFTHTVNVNNDLSITLSLPTYNHVIKFRQYLDDILNGYTSPRQGEESWFVQPCQDLLDGVIKRWYVQSIDKRSMPMVLKQTYVDGKTEEILVFRSPAVGLYYRDSPLDFDNVNMTEVRNTFRNELRDYYRLCHGNIEPVLLDRIDEMKLHQLLDLIEIKERYNEPTYCYSTTTLLSLSSPISPMTRRPYKDNIIIKALLMEWGWRGLFNTGSLIGLYHDMPSQILVQPTVGHPIIVKQMISDLQRNVTGDVYSVSVGFADGLITDLFDIATEDPSELKMVMEKLWHDGFFLSYWVSAVQKYTDRVNSFVVIVTKPLLVDGSNSKSNGERAMNYLIESADNL